jgi:hypothetical protein
MASPVEPQMIVADRTAFKHLLAFGEEGAERVRIAYRSTQGAEHFGPQNCVPASLQIESASHNSAAASTRWP